MNLDDILGFTRLECTGDKARAGWYLDQDAILAAMDRLDIKKLVKIRFTAARQRVGTHYAWIDHHRIMISQDDSVNEASNTLWHELTHAMQAEAFTTITGRPMNKFYREAYQLAKGSWGASYKDNKFEIQAREIADLNSHNLLVAI